MTTPNDGKPNFDKLNNLLTARGLNLNKLAVETGITRVTLYDWKNGKTNPKVDKIIKIAKYFGVTTDYFYEV